ncbi:MAG TPA: PTS sugar transporter subunit IIA [Aliidongia sp.]|nr:PTS sugar transporter subunit IIA [Aliidongia sp.]
MTELLRPATVDRIIADLRVRTKPDAFRLLARRAAERVGLPEDPIFEALTYRETLGTTAVGRGIAIPHAVIPELRETFKLFARLVPPVPFGAADGVPVSLVFLLLTPPDRAAESTHLLASICRALRDPVTLAAVSGAADDRQLQAVLEAAMAGRRQA